MQTYKYKAVSRDGSPVSGIIEAYDQVDAIARIKETCIVVEKISEVKKGREGSFLQMEIGKPKINEKALAIMCSQFSIILSAGLPMVQAVRLIADQTVDKVLHRVLRSVADDVATGRSLAQSFETAEKGIMPVTFVETVRSGEQAGTIDNAFAKLHTYYDKNDKIRAKVKGALSYPIFVSVVAVVVIIVLMAFVIPTFTKMFREMDIEMPLPTVILIGMSDFFAKWWALLLIIIAGLIVAAKQYGRTEDGRLRFARWQLKIPILGNIARLNSAEQLASTLSTMLASGIPMTEAVKITAKVLTNYQIAKDVSACVPGLEEGRRLAECLRKCPYVPKILLEMTAVGEETGALEETLDTIAAYYNSEVQQATTKALSMLEPAILVVMALVGGFIVIAAYLPMFSMYGGM